MNPLEVNKSNQVLYKQRNILLIISTAMIASNILFGIVALSKSERIVIMPHLKEEVSITGGSEFSESYIEQMTLFYVDMLLNVTPDNIEYKSKLLLSHVDAGGYHVFVDHFKEEKAKYKKYKLATRFDVTGLKILKNGLEVEVDGVLNSSFGKDKENKKPVKYVIGYNKSHGRLLLKAFSERV